MSTPWRDRWVSPCGRATLYLGDCREIVPTLPRPDAIVTDPPYGIAHASNHGASWNGRQIAGDADTSSRDAMVALLRDVPGAWFGTWKTRPVEGTRTVLVWDKGPASGMGDLSLPWKPSFELIYICGDGWAGRRSEGVLRGPTMVTWESAGRDHPHQKPEWLASHLLHKIPAARVVLDPYMGSGTTGVACMRHGARFIGCEIEPAYFEVAKRRITAAAAQPDLLIKETHP